MPTEARLNSFPQAAKDNSKQILTVKSPTQKSYFTFNQDLLVIEETGKPIHITENHLSKQYDNNLDLSKFLSIHFKNFCATEDHKNNNLSK